MLNITTLLFRLKHNNVIWCSITFTLSVIYRYLCPGAVRPRFRKPYHTYPLKSNG